jgi:ornithine cyclodeaminase/alanine dehydrogenase-like protein (mu-crystallin family)
MLRVTEEAVRRHLTMPVAVGLMRRVFAALAGGEAINQPRRRLQLPSGTVLHSMAGSYGRYLGTKVYSTNPKHGAHFYFLLFDAETGAPLAHFEANWLGQIRTGAASGFATDLLARPDAESVGVIGTGFQAASQLAAIVEVRRPKKVLVWSRKEANRVRFAAESAQRLQLPVEAAGSARGAVEGADIIVTATHAREPVIESGWVRDGAHVNAIGSNRAARREIPGELVHRAGLIAVDSIEQSKIESGDLLLAGAPETWGDWPLVELADVATGARGRKSPDAVTIFKSNGLAVEDVAAAGYVFECLTQGGEDSSGGAYS